MRPFYQVVHARVLDGHEQAMLELRPRFIAAMRAAVPGLIDAHLIRLDDGTWLDIVSWRSREAAAAVDDGHAVVPEAIEMGRHIAEIVAMHQGEAVEHPVSVT